MPSNRTVVVLKWCRCTGFSTTLESEPSLDWELPQLLLSRVEPHCEAAGVMFPAVVSVVNLP